MHKRISSRLTTLYKTNSSLRCRKARTPKQVISCDVLLHLTSATYNNNNNVYLFKVLFYIYNTELKNQELQLWDGLYFIFEIKKYPILGGGNHPDRPPPLDPPLRIAQKYYQFTCDVSQSSQYRSCLQVSVRQKVCSEAEERGRGRYIYIQCVP